MDFRHNKSTLEYFLILYEISQLYDVNYERTRDKPQLIFGHKNVGLKWLPPPWASQKLSEALAWACVEASPELCSGCKYRVCADFIWIKTWLRAEHRGVTSAGGQWCPQGHFVWCFYQGCGWRDGRAPSVLSVPRIPCPEYNFLTPHAISSSRPFWKWFRGFGDFFLVVFIHPL